MKVVKTFSKKGVPGQAHIVLIQDKYYIMAERADWTTDWPIKYRDGRIAYDNPYAIPKYLKKLVVKAFNYKEQNYV